LTDEDGANARDRLRAALHDYVERSPRASAIGIAVPGAAAADTSPVAVAEIFDAADVAPCLLRYRLHCAEGEPFGAADLLIGLGDTAPTERDAVMADLTAVTPRWAVVAPHGEAGISVSLPLPLMTPRGGFEAETAELALRWFRMLADWWHRTGRSAIPSATAPDRA